MTAAAWRYAVNQYVTKRGDRWRSHATRPADDRH